MSATDDYAKALEQKRLQDAHEFRSVLKAAKAERHLQRVRELPLAKANVTAAIEAAMLVNEPLTDAERAMFRVALAAVRGAR